MILMNHECRLLFLGETSYFLIRDCRVIISIRISLKPSLYSVYSIKRRLAILWRILLTGGPGVWRLEYARRMTAQGSHGGFAFTLCT